MNNIQRELQRLTWKDIRDLVPDKIDTVLFPVGTVEAHGAAALGTDNLIPESICAYLADKINALIAPCLDYGITRSLYGYPGSITIRPPHYEKFVADILKSFKDIGFKNIFVINGHGGNNPVLKTAAYDFYYEHKTNIAVIHWWELVGELTREHYGQAGGHAGLNENAMMHAIDESLVDKSQYDDNMAYFHRSGDIYPIPGSIILYKENEGLPDFDVEKAKAYQQKVFAEMEKFIRLILDRWSKI
jgi:creatinine amidohydrolase